MHTKFRGMYTHALLNVVINNTLGCPRVLRSDLGTENSNVAFIQPLLRNEHSDRLSGINSHCYGKSTSNQV